MNTFIHVGLAEKIFSFNIFSITNSSMTRTFTVSSSKYLESYAPLITLIVVLTLPPPTISISLVAKAWVEDSIGPGFSLSYL